MLVPILFLFIFGIVIAVAFFSAISVRASGGARPQHLRHRIDDEVAERPRIESQPKRPITTKNETDRQQDDYDDFFKEYDDFFEQDDDPFNEKK